MSRRPSALVAPILAACLFAAAQSVAQRPQFDPKSDYAYDLAATEAQVAEVQLDAEGFDLPRDWGSGDTVFLELLVSTTDAAEPAVEFSQGDMLLRQVFEEGARGRRFLDISPLLGQPAHLKNRVTMKGIGLSWTEGPARTFTFRNTLPTARGLNVLVLAPHPDDAEIAAFGLYSLIKADVITVTSGDAGGHNFEALFPEDGEHYRIKGWIRTWDSISVPFYGGVMPGKARNLGFYDAMLRKMHQAPDEVFAPLIAKLDDPGYYRRFNADAKLRERPFQGSWRALVDDIAWELRRTKPRVIVAPHPMLDAHADHQFTTIALIDALAKWDGECELWLYTNHALENEAWPLGDRDAMSGLPPWSGGDLHFRRIYSHPLSPHEQKLKLVALEAMHDLRDFDLRDGTDRGDAGVVQNGINYDYYRRGPRPNELFFVLTREDALEMRDAFLAGR